MPAQPRTRGEGLARFLELRGGQIVEAAGALWQGIGKGFYISLPYHALLDPDPAELTEMLSRAEGLGASFPSLTWPGLPGGLCVYRRGQPYTLSSVHPKQRARVRQGLERCEIRRVDESELLAQGLLLNLEIMEHRGRLDPEFSDPRRWRRLVDAILLTPGAVVLGSFVEGRLAAYAISYQEDGWLYILDQIWRPGDRQNCPNHALTFCLTQAASEDPEVDAVSYGPTGLGGTDYLHEHQLRFGYKPAPHSFAFHLNPSFSPVLINRWAMQLVSLARRVNPRGQSLVRLSAILEGAAAARGRRDSRRQAGTAPPV